MDWRLRVPSALFRVARDKAGSDKALADLVVRWLDQWANGTTPQALGGLARAAKLTPEERSQIARKAGYARHGLPVPDEEGLGGEG